MNTYVYIHTDAFRSMRLSLWMARVNPNTCVSRDIGLTRGSPNPLMCGGSTAIYSPWECEHYHPDSLDARLFPSVVYARRMGQPTQRATSYTARSNIDTAQIFLHANGQRPKRASIRQRSRRGQRRGEPHTEHGLGVLTMDEASSLLTDVVRVDI